MRLVVVSNRLPVTVSTDGEATSVRPATGGLVTALAPVLRNRGGIWAGWTGAAGEVDLGEILGPASREVGYQLCPLTLSEREVSDFYHGFSNEIIWPLFHDLLRHCNFVPQYWRTYLDVNRKFARLVSENSGASDYVWVHDYHLMHVAQFLRNLSEGHRRIGFFLHTPFPPVDIFVKLPWRSHILRALLEYDLVGFQTMRDRRNFIRCLRQLIPEAKAGGRGPVITLHYGGREVRVGCFSIGIGFDEFARVASSRAVDDRRLSLQEAHLDRQIILSVDRLDYTKGIPERLEGFRRALMRYPALHQKVTLVQVVVPSRESVPEYQVLKTEIERVIGQINGQFTRPDWVPIHYIYRHLSRDNLVANYRAADIALVTPLKDGMNLVAKEYCACNVEERGVLILSEFAGAAVQLRRGALLVNPYDSEGIADAIHRAFRMSAPERRLRMRKMRQAVRKTDIFWWVDSFMRAAFARTLEDFPKDETELTEHYIEKTPWKE
jgi:trehalose 6-phosphate synthase